MKHYTSYYGNFANIPKNYYCVGISRYVPQGFKDGNFSNFLWVANNFLAPDESTLQDKKAGKIDEEEYKRQYVTGVLTKVYREVGYDTLAKWLNAFDDHLSKSETNKWEAVVFLCYEKPGDFCHRNILSKLLRQYYGIECEELDIKNIQSHSNETKKEKTNALF